MNSGMGLKTCLKSLPSQMSQIPSVVANDPATNSDSIKERLMCDCFFEAHDIGDLLKLKSHPVVDFLSVMLPVKSTSVYLARLCAYPSTPFPSNLYIMLYSLVCNRYRTILFAASQCVTLGFDVNWTHLFTANEMSGHVAIEQ